MKTLKKLLCLILALVMVCSFAACGEKKEEEEEETVASKYGGTMRLIKAAAPTSFFPIYKSSNGAGYTSGCFEYLGKKDIITQELSASLAESWTYDKEACTVTIKIREGVKFHDGSDLTAEVVAWNYNFAKENNLLTSYHNFETTVIDEYTVQCKFDKFYIDTEASALTAAPMCSKKAYEENGLDYCLNHPVGTGAFQFVEYVTDQKISYVKFEDYWGTDEDGNKLPYLDAYEVLIITDSNAGMTAFVNGEADVYSIGDEAIVQDLVSNGYENKAELIPSSVTLFTMYPNSKVEDDPFSKLEVRQAVMIYGLDYANLRTLAGGSLALAAHSISVENSLMYDESIENAYTYDLEKAKQMLADAGYPDGFDTTIYAISITKNLATVLQELLKPLGINAAVEVLNTSDPIRTDTTTPGIYLVNGSGTWDITARPLGSMWTPVGVAGSKTQGSAVKVAYSDEYVDLYKQVSAAETYEQRAELGKKLLKMLYIDECYASTCYIKSVPMFINDKLVDSGCELNHPNPTKAYYIQ